MSKKVEDNGLLWDLYKSGKKVDVTHWRGLDFKELEKRWNEAYKKLTVDNKKENKNG